MREKREKCCGKTVGGKEIKSERTERSTEKEGRVCKKRKNLGEDGRESERKKERQKEQGRDNSSQNVIHIGV